jgi:hypothetical protein
MSKQTASSNTSRTKKKRLAVTAKATTKKKKNTVHEVKLKSQKSSVKGKIPTKKIAKPAKTAKLTKSSRENKVEASKVITTKAAPNSISTLISQELLTPSSKILKPFRDAAKRNKKLIKKLESKNRTRSTFLAKPSKTTKKFKLDLRIHSPATAGFFTMGGVDPVSALVKLAKAKNLDLIAVTDYYSAECVDLVQETAKETGANVIPGFDICCKVENCAEVFMIALFPETYTSIELNNILLQLQVPSSARGRRDFCLSTELSEVIAIVEKNGGVLIPSRLDKTPYRQLAIPHLIERHGFHAFDLVTTENVDYFKERWPEGGFTFFGFSNAYSLGQVGSREQQVKLEDKTFAAIKELVARRIN